MTKTTFTVKAIGPRVFRNKTFNTSEEANKYFHNLWNWKINKNNRDTWTVWVDTEKKVVKYTI